MAKIISIKIKLFNFDINFVDIKYKKIRLKEYNKLVTITKLIKPKSNSFKAKELIKIGMYPYKVKKSLYGFLFSAKL